MEQLGLQVRILMNEVDSQVQQGILHNCQDLYSIFASEEFTCVIDWNTINHKLSSRNIKKDHHHNEATHRMKYLYKESENPDEFFLPYIWNNVVSHYVLYVVAKKSLILLFSIDCIISRDVMATPFDSIVQVIKKCIPPLPP